MGFYQREGWMKYIHIHIHERLPTFEFQELLVITLFTADMKKMSITGYRLVEAGRSEWNRQEKWRLEEGRKEWKLREHEHNQDPNRYVRTSFMSLSFG